MTIRSNAVGSPHTHLAATKDRALALECARTMGPRYVVRVDAGGNYFVVPKEDRGYDGVGVLVASSVWTATRKA